MIVVEIAHSVIHSSQSLAITDENTLSRQLFGNKILLTMQEPNHCFPNCLPSALLLHLRPSRNL